jgi:hypothetical protein
MTKPKGRAAVADRGEFTLVLDGTNYVLRPSYEAIEEFEQETGKGMLQLSRDAVTGTLRLGEAAQVATSCIRAWGRANDDQAVAHVGFTRIAELILESPGGFNAALATIGAALAVAVTGGCTASGEVKPAPKSPSTEEAPDAG